MSKIKSDFFIVNYYSAGILFYISTKIGVVMREIKIRKMKFGTCCFCGGKTKFYQRSHKQCKKLFLEGNKRILSLSDELQESEFNINLCDAIVQEAQTANFINEEEKKELLILAWENGLDAVLEKGLLSEKIEDNFNLYAEHFNLTQYDLDKKNKYMEFAKARILRKVTEGELPDFVKVDGSLPFNFLKNEKIIWVFQDVDYSSIHDRVRYEGGSIGASFRVARGVYFRTSSFKGNPVHYQSNEYIDTGILVVTDKHIYFGSPSQNFRIKYEKIVSFRPYSDGIGIQRDAMNAKPQVFTLDDGWFAYNLLINIAKIHG